MKKFKLLAAMLAIPALCFAGDLQKSVNNSYDWAASITSSNNPAWQIYNSSTNVNTVYVDCMYLSSDKGGYFTIYSTNVGTGFTGAKVSGTPTSSVVTGGNVSISSVTTCTNASAATGNVMGYAVVTASDTVEVENTYAIKPGSALYVIKDNGAAGEKASATFRLIESPR